MSSPEGGTLCPAARGRYRLSPAAGGAGRATALRGRPRRTPSRTVRRQPRGRENTRIRGRTGRSGGRRALLFAVAGAVMSVVFFPVGIVLDVAAIVLAFRARRRASRSGGTAPLSAPPVVIGGIGSSRPVCSRSRRSSSTSSAPTSRARAAPAPVARQECNDEFRITGEPPRLPRPSRPVQRGTPGRTTFGQLRACDGR